MNLIKETGLGLLGMFFLLPAFAQPINRKALVQRHTIHIQKPDTLSSLTVGNGRFAFTVDVTGLQSFPDQYAGGIPLGTQSEWGWHSFPNTQHYKLEDAYRNYTLNGRQISYAMQWNQPLLQKNTSDYFRQNQHRLQLGNIGLEILLKNGKRFDLEDIQNIQQTLDMWTGKIHSRFSVEGIPVEVITYCHQQKDLISVQIQSALIKAGRMGIRMRFPYPTGQWSDKGNYWKEAEKHTTEIVQQTANSSTIKHTLDTTRYFLRSTWKGNAQISQPQPHYFLITPTSGNVFEIGFSFEEQQQQLPLPAFKEVMYNSEQNWQAFWQSGAAVDFSGSTDVRAKELERRVILSQYLTKIQCAGNQPPQETGLTYNSWYGKPHLEMHWWHGVHFALWGRPALLEKSMPWYRKAAPIAKSIATRQGFEGIRWQKMTDPDGREVPSSIGTFLIWQQPHYIYFAELLYRHQQSPDILHTYSDLVFATADFMASFAYYDSVTRRYQLGKGLIPAQERFKAEDTFNPAYELAYWYWALHTAQSWRQRLGMPVHKKWESVLKNISALPVQDGKYLFAENATDSYTNETYRTDHPAVLGAIGMLPVTPQTDTAIMHQTLNWVMKEWNWSDTWGWDFPMVAMTATRLGLPELAVNALLMPVKTNTYLVNGHNFQDNRLTLYLPGNGGLLAAVALMCAGDDSHKNKNPGFPVNGWKVKWEGFKKMM